MRGRGNPRQFQPPAPWPSRGVTPRRRIPPQRDEDNQLSLAGLEIKSSLRYKSKREPGTNGQPISLLTNHFLLQYRFRETVFFHHYNVIIEKVASVAEGGMEGALGETETPRSSKRSRKLEQKFNMQIIDTMVQHYGEVGGIFHGIFPVYDGGNNLYTRIGLDTNSDLAVQLEDGIRFRFEINIQEFPHDSETSFIILLKHVAMTEINPDWSAFPQEAIQFIDILLRYGPTRQKLPVGSKIYFPNLERRERLCMDKNLAFGFYQSARNSECGLVLNVDRALTVFHNGGPMLTIFDQCFPGVVQSPRIPENVIKQMTNELRGLRFTVRHLTFPKKYKIHEFSLEPANELTFTMKIRDANGGVVEQYDISVANYYAQTHENFQLQFPNLPCVVTGNKKNPKYFPLELCVLLGDQYVTRKLHPGVLALVSRTASFQDPSARFQKISQSLNECIQPDGQLYSQEFGVRIFPQFIQLNARVLQAPNLMYSDEEIFTPDQKCSWTMQQPSEKHFFQAATNERWLIVNMARNQMINDTFLRQFSIRLQETAHVLGMQMAPHMVLVRANFVNKQTLKNNVFERAKTMHPQLILFIIPELSECYGSIKTLGDLTYGIVTQCVLEKNYAKFSKVAFLTNLLLKINAKINGVNAVLDMEWTQQKIMFVGIDVTHPSPGDGYSLSIASCVGSYDNTFSRYTAKLKAQERAKKEIVELDVLMQQLLETYGQVNHCLPEIILIYRDGVSEGQFDQVMEFEVTKLKKLFEKMNYNPRITYTVVQKRHNARFIPARRQDATPNGNIPAGTTVDTVITDPLKVDFYLCSHDGSLGTSRPSRYWVLYDENNFKTDDIQEITFAMCFLYPRCTRSVSIPVPVHFAHLSAYRARHHIAIALGPEAMFVESGDEQLTADEKKRRLEAHRQRVNNILRVNPIIANSPYFA